MNFVANIPYLKCWVKKEYLHDLEKGHGEFVECVLLAVKSIQGRALMFEAYLPDYGACFDKFPISAFVWKTDIKLEEQLPLGTLELWDGFSNNRTGGKATTATTTKKKQDHQNHQANLFVWQIILELFLGRVSN